MPGCIQKESVHNHHRWCKGARINKWSDMRRISTAAARSFDLSMAGSCDGRRDEADEVRDKQIVSLVVAGALGAV